MDESSFSVLVFLKSFMVDGGIFMRVILFNWVFGVSICIYKLFSLSALNVNGRKLFDKIKASVLQNRVDDALALCGHSNAILPKILRAGLKRANEDRTLVEDAITCSVMEHTPRITYQLSYISLAANVSTLLGLLGTIQGLIISFVGVAGADPSAKGKILAAGIAKAMNTTALGLVCAITLMIIHSFLANRATKMNDVIDEAASKLIDLLSVKKSKGSSEN